MCGSRKSSFWTSFVAIGVYAMGGVAGAAWGDVFNLPSGQTSLQFVTVGDPGNAADTTGYGSVPYIYSIGEYDVTVAQYTQMLNSVAQTDTYGLYNLSMSPANNPASCGIIRGGTAGNYSYSYVSGHQNFPVNAVSWGDAARFCNWLYNGQPTTGVENLTTTEDGSYALNGAVSDQALNLVARSPTATYVIPTENEWYKSAYGSPTAIYTLYPTGSNNVPSNVLNASGMNNANYNNGQTFTDPINFLTPVGSFADSPSNYLTFDQGGDVSQWDEAIIDGGRGFRGGAYSDDSTFMESTTRLDEDPTAFGTDIGFRVAEVPEPTSIALLVIGAAGLLCRRRRART
jgi:formylglycine-generating enzyme required for sulfatase activity